jgi:hypothetical protein
MEIKFELENCDTEYIFTPDFVVSANHTDETKISWRLSDNRSAEHVGVLFPGVQAKNSIHPPGSDRDNL